MTSPGYLRRRLACSRGACPRRPAQAGRRVAARTSPASNHMRFANVFIADQLLLTPFGRLGLSIYFFLRRRFPRMSRTSANGGGHPREKPLAMRISHYKAERTDRSLVGLQSAHGASRQYRYLAPRKNSCRPITTGEASNLSFSRLDASTSSLSPWRITSAVPFWLTM